jgi:hypothetical protein
MSRLAFSKAQRHDDAILTTLRLHFNAFHLRVHKRAATTSMRNLIPPMTLGNMRANGVRTLGVWCTGRGYLGEMMISTAASGPNLRS